MLDSDKFITVPYYGRTCLSREDAQPQGWRIHPDGQLGAFETAHSDAHSAQTATMLALVLHSSIVFVCFRLFI